MSTHGTRATARHPDPARFTRERFEVGHVTFEVCDHPENGVTFALIAGRALHAGDRRPMFSGHVELGMAAQLRCLADRLDILEDRL